MWWGWGVGGPVLNKEKKTLKKGNDACTVHASCAAPVLSVLRLEAIDFLRMNNFVE